MKNQLRYLIKPKKKNIELYFNLITYTAIINIFCTHAFYHSFIELNNGNASGILARDIFFLLCYVALSGFISSRKHIVIQSIIIILLIAYYQWVLDDVFFVENGPVYTLAVIGFSVVMYFFTTIVKDSIENFKQSNEALLAMNNELFSQSEELEATLSSLQTTQNQLIKSEKMASLGILSSGIAHEINNPLNFIHGGITGIESYFKENIPDHAQKIESLINAVNVGVKRASDIVTSLNHYSRLDEQLETECDINSIIDNCLVMLHNQLKNRIIVTKQYTNLLCIVLGSEGKLHQAFLNIIANAEQAILREGTIEIKTEVIHDSVSIIISDSGSGIHTENLEKIFDPFFTTKDPGKGTGLGLAITYNIIKEHKGTIAFESQQRIGTKVIINLPRIAKTSAFS